MGFLGGGGRPPAIYPTPLTSAAPTSASLTKILFSGSRDRRQLSVGQEDDGCLHGQLGELIRWESTALLPLCLSS